MLDVENASARDPCVARPDSGRNEIGKLLPLLDTGRQYLVCTSRAVSDLDLESVPCSQEITFLFVFFQEIDDAIDDACGIVEIVIEDVPDRRDQIASARLICPVSTHRSPHCGSSIVRIRRHML